MAAKKINKEKEIKEIPGRKDQIFNELYEYAELAEPSELERMQKKYNHWRLSHNYEQRTIETQGTHLYKFVKWCLERGILRPQDVTREMVELYQGYLSRSRKDNGEPYSIRYRNRILSTLKGFFAWLAKNHYILYNPAAELELPRESAQIPRNILSTAEVEAIMMQVDLSWPLGLRDRAMLETLYSTGIRSFELCRLKCKDIYSDNGVLLVREGKGRKDRMIPIGERALVWVEKYKNDLRPALVTKLDEEVLFLSNTGNPFNPRNLSRIVSEYIKAAGIEKEGACHMFRHTMATLMLENGADIRYIQQILGHASLDTTQIYTQVSIKKLKEVHTNTHPAARLKSQQGGRSDQ
jgi:integrase/recombinase XerD